MLLYRHSARCPVAMQWFLDYNPNFWPFVPMSQEQGVDTSSHLQTDSPLADLPPLPSSHYHFSADQRKEQLLAFEMSGHRLPFSVGLDLYNATIVAVCQCLARAALVSYTAPHSFIFSTGQLLGTVATSRRSASHYTCPNEIEYHGPSGWLCRRLELQPSRCHGSHSHC